MTCNPPAQQNAEAQGEPGWGQGWRRQSNAAPPTTPACIGWGTPGAEKQRLTKHRTNQNTPGQNPSANEAAQTGRTNNFKKHLSVPGSSLQPLPAWFRHTNALHGVPTARHGGDRLPSNTFHLGWRHPRPGPTMDESDYIGARDPFYQSPSLYL